MMRAVRWFSFRRLLCSVLLGAILTACFIWGWVFVPRGIQDSLDLNVVRAHVEFLDSNDVAHKGERAVWATEWSTRYVRDASTWSASDWLGPELPKEAPSWARIAEKPQKPNDIVFIVSHAHGWPFRGAAWYDRQTLHNYLSDTGPRGISSESESVWEVGGRYFLPLQPIWAGLLANLLIYACGAYALLTALAVTRATLRSHRGRCPRCAYDLRHDLPPGCPECGWNREPN